MLTEVKGHKGQTEPEKKTHSDLRAEEEKIKMLRREFRTQIYDSYVYIDEIKKSDEVFMFQSKMEL